MPEFKSMRSTTVYLTKTQAEELRELSGATRVPVAEYIREGVNHVLNKYRDKYKENPCLERNQLTSSTPSTRKTDTPLESEPAGSMTGEVSPSNSTPVSS